MVHLPDCGSLCSDAPKVCQCCACWQRQQLAAGGVQHAARTPLLECSPGLAAELSKLSTVQTYPEFARALLESAPVGFNSAVSEWEKRHGKVQGI